MNATQSNTIYEVIDPRTHTVAGYWVTHGADIGNSIAKVNAPGCGGGLTRALNESKRIAADPDQAPPG